MKKVIAATMLLVLLILSTAHSTTAEHKSSSQEISFALNALGCPKLAEFINMGHIEKALNPDMATLVAVREFREECEAVRNELVDLRSRGVWTESWNLILETISLYLLYSSDEAMIIALDDHDYPVLGRLRQAIHLKSPVGFAFVRLDVLGGILDDLKGVDNSDKQRERGNTMLVRYVTLKMDKTMSTTSRGNSKRFNDVLSHELVHVYMNALLGLSNVNELPEWFTEGSALYFAKNEPSELVSSETRGNTEVNIISSLPQDYLNYLRVFKYLSSIKSRDPFEKFVADSIATHSVNQPLEEFVGDKSFRELLADAKHWENINSCRYICYGLMVICIVWIRLLVLIKRKIDAGDLPEERSQMSYSGIFISGGECLYDLRRQYAIGRIVRPLVLLGLVVFTSLVLPRM